MKIRRNNKLLVEPPPSATGDIAFILIVFFLVCASVQPDSGRKQDLPRSEEKEQKEEQSENIEVNIGRDSVIVNGEPLPARQVETRLLKLLEGKQRESDRIVVVKSKPDSPYHFWIQVTGAIEQAGGIITLQIEEEREVMN